MIYPSLQLPAQQSKRVLGERKQALAIPLGLLDTNLLLLRSVDNLDVLSANSMNLHLLTTRQPPQLRLKVLLLMDIHNSKVDNTILIKRSTNIQPRRLNSTADPLRMRRALILSSANIHSDCRTAHVLAVEEERPPGRLLKESVFCGHEGRNDVYALGDVGHAHVLGLADEDVEPDCYGEGVREVVFLFGAFFAGRADWIPYIPLVEADLLAADGGGHFVLDASEVDETGCDLDSTLSRTRG